MCDCCGAHLCGLTQKEGWNIPGEGLGLGQLWVALLKKSLSCCCALSSPGTAWGKSRSREEKPLAHPVGTGTRQANHGSDLIKTQQSPSLSSPHSSLLLQQKNGKCVGLCVSSREKLTLCCQSPLQGWA